MSVSSPYHCTDIEKAVLHPLYTDDERADMIQRHHARKLKEYTKIGIGFFVEKTGNE